MTHSALPTVGFIGLGNMGSGMTRNLLKSGFPLIVTDIRREAAEPILTAGARWADTAAEVAEQSDVVITMLPAPQHVRQVMMGEHGVLAGIRAGGTWIDMSTSIPEVAESVRADYAHLGLRILDAPVSGMSVGAANGTLQIFIGGDAADVAQYRPVFEAMGDPERILHVGPAGAGYAVKLMINQLWFSHLVATAEVLAVGVKAGVDLDVLRKSLMASPADSNFLRADVLSVLNDGDYDEGFAIALACKDLGLSNDLSAAVGIETPLAALIRDVYERARTAYGDRAGEMTPIALYEDQLGHTLRLNPAKQGAATA